MKNLLLLSCILACFVACNTPSKSIQSSKKEVNSITQDTVRIANEEVEYEIIIIEPGFNSWLLSYARPKGYYSQNFLESRNQLLVREWNLRVNQPHIFDPSLYQLRIDYNPNIDYGYDVNYKLYNYFIYFQLHYKQQLSSFIPRI